MMSGPTRVTIGVPVYNGAAMLAEMLESLRRQTYRHFRVVICDNASTDDTATIARRFVETDARFSYQCNQTNIGAAPNFNRVFELDHSTPYYKWAAHDDLYEPTYLERCVAALDDNPDVVVAYPVTLMVDETGRGKAPAELGLEQNVLDSFVDAAGRPAWVMGPLHVAEGEDPVERLDEQLGLKLGSFEIFGVMRTAAIERTKLHASYYGSDRALLAQLVLMGRFHQVPERLYVNRFHKAASRNMAHADLRTWIDTKGGTRWYIARMHWDILCAAVGARLGARDRIRAILVAIGDVARLLTMRVRRKAARITRATPRLSQG
jgi:glycosyltransferase involved in cell wall biosynthesis